MIRHEVPASLREENLQRYLKRAWPLLPGHVLRELMKKRDVRVNGAKCGRDDAVRGGDVLEIVRLHTWIWPRESLESAARQVHVSTSTAKRMYSRFVYEAARAMGYRKS